MIKTNDSGLWLDSGTVSQFFLGQNGSAVVNIAATQQVGSGF